MGRPKDIQTAEGRERHEAKYQKILDAALYVFATKGFHEAKISEIARQGGVADGTIYLYFKSKDDLLISLFKEKLTQILDGLKKEIEPIESVRERFHKIITYHLAVASNDPTLASFITLELRRSAKFMREYTKIELTAYLDEWAKVIQSGKDAGVFRSDFSVTIFVHMLFGALDQACVAWVNNPQREKRDLEEVGRQLSVLFYRAIAV